MSANVRLFFNAKKLSKSMVNQSFFTVRIEAEILNVGEDGLKSFRCRLSYFFVVIRSLQIVVILLSSCFFQIC